jgi:hypothetical protein
VRRLVALFVLALLGATFYGLSSSSSGIAVNNQTLSANILDSELSAISHNNTLQCYVTALNPTSYAPGAGGYSIKAAGAAAWANLRVEGLAIDQYVTKTLKYEPSAHDLALAQSSLEGEMTSQVVANVPTGCPGTSTQAISAMPSEMRTAEILAQADSLYLVQKIKTTTPLTTASMKSYYAQHTSSYDTLCVSVSLVLPTSVTAFAQGEAAGLSVATLVKQYSQDAVSAAKGGAVGCFSPSSTSYANVRADVTSLPLNTFATTPNYISNNGQTYALYVAVTKRTTTPFNAAAATVLADLQSLNASSANALKNDLLYAAAVHVDPAFGRWGLNTTGPNVFASAKPAASDVTGTKKLNALSATYK